MKIKCKDLSYEEVMKLPRAEHKDPKRPSGFYRKLVQTLSRGELKKVHFTFENHGMERLGAEEPCLILMNHSSFIDLKIAETIFKDRPLNIICTSDGFVGKEGLLRNIGCVPTQKFVSDTTLIKDMVYCLRTLKDSVLLFPEASYSFDGTATPLPQSLGKCLKLLKVPVVMVRTHGAFLRDPLYNGLQVRDVPVSADVTYLLSPEEIAAKPVEELNDILREAFTFDNWEEQRRLGIKVREPFRADGLNRVLFQCAHCGLLGQMKGSGTRISCGGCGTEWELMEDGDLYRIPTEAEKASRAEEPETEMFFSLKKEFRSVPEWYAWERKKVREEILADQYRLEIPVEIRMMVDMKSIYHVGEGTLVHTPKGFHLTGCDGKLDYRQAPEESYGLYADYYWYEIGDMICIGNRDALYYCFPKNGEDVVARTRMAAEEMYQIALSKKHNLGG